MLSITAANTFMRLLYFSPVSAGSYAQRPHFMVRALLDRGVESVLWVNPYPCRLPRWNDLRRIGGRVEQGTRLDPRVHVLNVPALPIEPLPLGAWLNRQLLGRNAWRCIEHFAGGADIPVCQERCSAHGRQECLPHHQEDPPHRYEKDDLLIGIGRPCALSLAALRRLHPAASFYDAMDNFPEFHRGLSRRSIRRYEDAIAAEVDLVVASSTFLADKFIARGLCVEKMLNAYEEAGRQGDGETGKQGEGETRRRGDGEAGRQGDRQAERKEGVASSPHLAVSSSPGLPVSPSPPPRLPLPILGYLGCIGRWFDWPLIVRLAEAMPQARIELVGPCAVPPPPGLPANVTLLPACDRSEAGKHLARFSAGLIPFCSDALTAGVDPMKYYDYRAAGLPVLSTCFGEMALRGGEDGVCLLDGAGELAEKVTAALAHRCDPVETSQFRRNNTWASRFRGSDGLQSLLLTLRIRRAA